MNKTRFYWSVRIAADKFGFGIVFEKWEGYSINDPDTYVCCLYLGPVWCWLGVEWDEG